MQTDDRLLKLDATRDSRGIVAILIGGRGGGRQWTKISRPGIADRFASFVKRHANVLPALMHDNSPTVPNKFAGSLSFAEIAHEAKHQGTFCEAAFAEQAIFPGVSGICSFPCDGALEN